MEWSKDLQAQPHSLSISRQGHRIAVGYERFTQVFDGASGNPENLPTAVPSDQASLQVDSQCMSFSICGDHLVIATREKREGWVFVGVHDLPPLPPHSQRMRDFRIPTVGFQYFFQPFPAVAESLIIDMLIFQKLSRDFRLSSIVYDSYSSTICVCSSTSQGRTYLISRATTFPTEMTHQELKPFPGDQIQCAALLPGKVPQIVLVNDSNEIFSMRRKDNGWKPAAIKIKLERARKDVGRFDEKMSIAATENGVIRTFWIQGGEGRLLSARTDVGGPFIPEKISMEGFLQ